MKKPINPVFPVAGVETVDQLMDIATAMEREAAHRYEALAGAMDRRGNAETAALFRQLAADEREHEAQLARWAVREDDKTPSPAAVSWPMPETFDWEGAGGSYTLTPYRALSIAVRNEERAFAFYSYLAAIAETDAVRGRAEALAKGELDHVKQLRSRRRQAYHAQRRGGRQRFTVATLEDMDSLALALEKASAELNRAIAKVLADAGEETSASMIRHLAGEAGAGAGEGVPAVEAQEFSGRRGVLGSPGITPLGALRLGLKNAEEVLETYMDIAEHAKDEAVLREAQRLGEQGLARVAIISSRVQELSG